MDQAGQALLTKPKRVARWREYFCILLNVPTQVEVTELDGISCLLFNEALTTPLTFEETVVALSKLKAGKACGPDGLEAELLQSLQGPAVRLLHEYFCRVWEGVEDMPDEWKQAYLVPLPKNGDLTQCSRWRSIPGQIYVRILNGR